MPDAFNVEPCPQCKAIAGQLSGLTVACMGSKNKHGRLLVAVICQSCGYQGPICEIHYANATQEPWDGFWSVAVRG